MKCGRIRKQPGNGWTQLTDRELNNQKLALLRLEAGATFELSTEGNEYAVVILAGEVKFNIRNGLDGQLGPRRDVFQDLPEALLLTRDQQISIQATVGSELGLHYAPAQKQYKNYHIRKEDVRVNERGADNWRRQVRKIIWNDNTEGNAILTGETVTYPGNWSTMPPHRHQFYEADKEMPYEEGYLFKFSKSQGFGLIYQFDESMDQAFSLKNNDVAYIGGGYHPVVAAPGSHLYHLTCMAGPMRMSQARVHEDYEYLLSEQGMENQFTPKS